MLRVLLIGCVVLAVAALSGCAQHAATVARGRPLVAPEPSAVQDATLLERFQEACRQYNSERAQNAALTAELAETRRARDASQVELEKLRQQAAVLELKAKELDALRTKSEETQKACLDLERATRDLRRDLLQEKLTTAKQEQMILAMKIEKAMERRKQPMDASAEAKATVPASSPENVNHAATR